MGKSTIERWWGGTSDSDGFADFGEEEDGGGELQDGEYEEEEGGEAGKGLHACDAMGTWLAACQSIARSASCEGRLRTASYVIVMEAPVSQGCGQCSGG